MSDKVMKFTCECFRQLSIKLRRIEPPDNEEDIKQLLCDKCEMKFFCERHLDLHKTIHNPPQSAKKKFKSKFKSYIKVSSVKSLAPEFNEKPNVCEICGKSFSTRGALKNHNRSHAVKYMCGECGDGFSAEEPYKRHLRGHENGKVYNCGICDKDFRRPKNLYRHIQMHEQNLML